MKSILTIIAFLPISAQAADDWSKADIAREAVFVGLTLIDWNQTRQIAQNPNQYVELNPLLGKHPSVKRVDSYMALSLITHAVITNYMPSKYRSTWQYVTITIEAAAVGNNYKIGLNLSF